MVDAQGLDETNAPVTLRVAEGIAALTLNRPAALNALDADTTGRLLRHIEAIAARDDVRAITLAGAGRAFCAGGDVARFTGDVAAEADAIIRPLHAALALLAELPQPSLAILHGAVAGAGFSLALACDLAICADDARFTLAYARLGTTPDGSATWSLPRLVGLRRAKEIALLADPLDATQALALGLVNRVVPAGDLAREADALARRLAAGPTLAYGTTKALLDAAHGRTLREQMEAERLAFAASTRTADFAQGVSAFRAKRAPAFRGR